MVRHASVNSVLVPLRGLRTRRLLPPRKGQEQAGPRDDPQESRTRQGTGPSQVSLPSIPLKIPSRNAFSRHPGNGFALRLFFPVKSQNLRALQKWNNCSDNLCSEREEKHQLLRPLGPTRPPPVERSEQRLWWPPDVPAEAGGCGTAAAGTGGHAQGESRRVRSRPQSEPGTSCGPTGPRRGARV